MSPCDSFIETLHARGFRITPQREMIIEAIAHQGEHINADEVYSVVHERAQAVNIATVYRTLDLLVEQGLASRIDLGEGRVIYANPQHGPHLHLVCRMCGQVFDASPELLTSLSLQLKADYQFAADLQHISVPGLCKDCQVK